ncbi:hypothetical protein CsSME_00052145 [Camellia sinensis var. sinensis]
MAGIVVVFDFDKTIIDLDSDNWVIDELGATDLFNQLLPTMPWNSLMDRMMMELHSQGKTIDDVAEVLKRAPIHPRIVPAIKAAHALGYTNFLFFSFLFPLFCFPGKCIVMVWGNEFITGVI